MDYTQLTDRDVDRMIGTIGIGSVDELFAGIDPKHRLRSRLNMPAGLSEMELLADLDRLASKNTSTDELVCFLGGGAYDHFVPTIVDHLATQSEFLTAYTPYQAEASQGSLQAFYEFQTMICQLTGMDVANASLYEGATAAAEAMMMARSITGKRRVLVSRGCHPDTVQVLQTYTRDLPGEVVIVPTRDGLTPAEDVEELIDHDTAAVIVQSPNFFGCIERVDEICDRAHLHAAAAIVAMDPISAGVLKPPGALGADIVVGEGQPLGIALQYGAPYLGFLACRQEFVRKMPGRIVGRGLDREGNPGYCLTLQTREQHIKREKATSNVCTNQGLFALKASVYMAAVGKVGLRRIASLCLDKAHYAADAIADLDDYSVAFGAPFFKEFVVRTDRDVDATIARCREKGVLAGVPLGRWYDDMKDCFLVAVTEKRTKGQIDALVKALGEG